MGKVGSSLQGKQKLKLQWQNAPVAAAGAWHAQLFAHMDSKLVQVKIRLDGELFVQMEEENLDSVLEQMKVLQKHISYLILKTATMQVLADNSAQKTCDLRELVYCQADDTQ